MNEVKTISVARALVELKDTDASIKEFVSKNMFVAMSIGRGDKMRTAVGQMPLPDLRNGLQSNKDKIDYLLRKRAALKSAIVLSNAQTFVMVDGVSMTVAEAIELRSTITLKEEFAEALSDQYNYIVKQVQDNNSKLRAEAEKRVLAYVGGDRTKLEPDSISKMEESLLSEHEHALLDPNGVSKMYDELTASIRFVRKELDLLLTESNATTTISYSA